VAPAAGERIWRPGRPVSVGATLSAFVRGRSDPCHRGLPDGSWLRASRTPAGPALLHLLPRPAGADVLARAWGPDGAVEWALDGVPDLLGARDDDASFSPAREHPRLVAAHRARTGWHVPRSQAVLEALVPAALEQRVTGQESRRAWRLLVTRFGTPAPGPGGGSGLFVPPDAAGWAAIPSWEWLRAGVEEARSRVVLAACRVAGGLERTVDVAPGEAARLLRSVPGVGVWTAAEIRQRAHGDADAFSWSDYHVAANVSWALTGQPLDDAGCAQVIERYRGHRYRVQRLLELDGVARPRRAPRMTLPTHLPRVPGG